MREVLLLGDPRLRIKPKPLELPLDEARLVRIFDEMIETMVAYRGIGLAAPQIGIDLPLAVVTKVPSAQRKRPPKTLEVWRCVNLEIVDNWGVWVTEEGCLSVPPDHFTNAQPARPRWKWIEASFLNPDGEPETVEAEELQAQIFQHEADHLQGRLYLDADRRFMDEDVAVPR